MPRSSTGKWVARAASTGGGRTYRGQVPINWYAVLVLIVLLGVASVVVSRIDYRSGPVVNTTPPLKGATPWYAAISFDICGTQRAPLPANLLNATTQSFYTTGNGIITISPKQTSDAGHNAVLGKFVSSYPGLTLTATQLHLPAPTTTTAPGSTTTTAPGSTTSTTAPGSTTSTSSTSTTTSTSSTSTTTSTTTSTSSPSGKKVKSASGRTYRSGEKCPSGTKDAGKTADVMVTYWKNAFAAKGKPVTVQGNPGTLLFSDDQLITVGFVPAGTRLPKPNSTIVTALFDIASGRSTTTTTAPGSTTTTTAPGSTTTTTAPGSTTTTAPGSTTTSTTTKAG